MDDFKSFGAAADFGVGNQDNGFNNPAPGGFDTSSSMQQGTPESSRKPIENKTVRPVVIKQIHEAEQPETQLELDGKPLSQVTFVGIVLSITEGNTQKEFMIDDGTGKINARLYLDAKNSGAADEIRENMYVRVYGMAGRWQKNNKLTVYKIQPVTDHNEVTYHFLDVLHSHLNHTRPQNHSAPSMTSAPMGAQIEGFGAPSATNNENFTKIQSDVLRIFESGTSEDGVAVATVLKHLPQYSKPDVSAAVEFLCNEGHLYSTVDDDHYACTAQP